MGLTRLIEDQRIYMGDSVFEQKLELQFKMMADALQAEQEARARDSQMVYQQLTATGQAVKTAADTVDKLAKKVGQVLDWQKHQND
ncbi:hypothetical protein GPECTOR_1060g337 [Gonium pectorale]|uniref:Uncharacterized protein n=1 Tax=Gonium pectorale TaxID=33097 RepID=A0A150FTQ1_GONPE|nr:hypothetical protein GPECTOR_1060g337 [Gonium pectorale]|eukprot:KXZ40979.1 hypothetical protein GPECTOR_1060g337 [Gonium pectorale]